MTQETRKQLSECRKCKENGYPSTMIGFIKDAQKTKPDGRPFWLLKNAGLSDHVHRSPITLSELRDIESDQKPPARPPMMKDKPQLTDDEIQTLKQFVAMLKLMKI